MKIEYSKISQLNQLITDAVGRKRLQNVQGNQDVKGELDATSFSKEGQFLSKVMQQLQSSSDVRSDKVEEMRKQIVDGSYQYNYEEIARKMAKSLDWE